MTLNPEQIISDAEVAAIYFRSLTDKGVPSMAAIQLTCSYVSSVLITRNGTERPREPWERPE